MVKGEWSVGLVSLDSNHNFLRCGDFYFSRCAVSMVCLGLIVFLYSISGAH